MCRKFITTLKFLRKRTNLSNLSAGAFVNVGGVAVDGIIVVQVANHVSLYVAPVAVMSVAP